MTTPKKIYSRHYFVRHSRTLWRDDPARAGSMCRQILMTSDGLGWTQGIFQVYALEGKSGGIKDQKLAAAPEEPTLLYDKDFDKLETAVDTFKGLVADAEKQGFNQMSELDELEFQQKLRNP